MRILASRADVQTVQDEGVRRVLDMRFSQLGDIIGDTSAHDVGGVFVLAETGDAAEAIEDAAGFPILHNVFDDAQFGDEDFAPAFEWCYCHDGQVFEMLFTASDAGDFCAVLVPRRDGVDERLLALASAFATPDLPPA